MTRVAVTGATGRMGRAILDGARGRDDVEVVLAVSRSVDGEEAGGHVESATNLESLLAEREPHVLVDFTGPESTVEYVRVAAEAGVAVVVGTTGFNENETSALREAADTIPILKAANFSRGVQALLAAVEAAVERLPGYDVELTETHHNGKRDAPSGTAKTILDRIEATRDAGGRVHGREGVAPRGPGEIGVHARRAGDITGEHEVLLADNSEVLTLAHRAESRGVFAAGALDAASWLSGREPGWYDFSRVVEGVDSR